MPYRIRGEDQSYIVTEQTNAAKKAKDAFDIARRAQPLAEGTQTDRIRVRRGDCGKPDHRHRRLLRHRERPRRRAAEQCDELAAFHSITSSASASSFG